MPKPRIDYAAIQRFVLVMMYEAFVRDQRMEFSIGRVQNNLPVPTNLVTVTFERLERDHLVEETTRKQTRTTGVLGDKTVTEWVGTGSYVLTERGRTQVEKMKDE